MDNSFLNRPLFRLLWPSIYGSVIYLLILLLNNNLAQLNESFFGQELYFCVILTYMIFELNRFVMMVSARKENGEGGFLNISNMILLNVLATSVVVVASVSIYFKAILGFTSWSTFSVELVIFLIIFIFSTLFYVSIAISNMYLFRENRDRLFQEQILKENLELELIKYKNEINPDLLYDSLESLISLIHKSAEEAENYIDKMALLYRYILSSRTSELVTLDQEYKAASNIISLLNEKYHNNIKLSNHISTDYLDRLAIPGTLSNVVESIIRNTIINDHQPVQINIETGKDGYLVVSHSLNEKLHVHAEPPFKRLQNAYAVYSDKPVVSVKAFGENFIKIPLLQLNEELV